MKAIGLHCFELRSSTGTTSSACNLDEDSLASLFNRGYTIIHLDYDEETRKRLECTELMRIQQEKRETRKAYLTRYKIETTVENFNGDTTNREKFLQHYLIAAAHEAQYEIVRRLLVLTKQYYCSPDERHKILLYRNAKYGVPFDRTALAWAVENNDSASTMEILHHERECHSDKLDGLQCLRQQLRYGGELLPWTIKTFSSFYEKTFFQKYIISLFYGLLCFATFLSASYDYYSDWQQSLLYHSKSTLATDFNSSMEWKRGPLNCSDYALTQKEYTQAYWLNQIVIYGATFLFMWNLIPNAPFPQNKAWQIASFPLRLILLPVIIFFDLYYQLSISLVISLLTLLLITAMYAYYTFCHLQSTCKGPYHGKMQQYERILSLFRNSESGVEATGQLVLQLWLLSSNFFALHDTSLLDIIDSSFKGLRFYLFFSLYDASDLEKSLGKLLMSMISVIIGMTSRYKELKHGSVSHDNAVFLYLETLLKVMGRVLSLWVCFFPSHILLSAVLVIFIVPDASLIIVYLAYNICSFVEHIYYSKKIRFIRLFHLVIQIFVQAIIRSQGYVISFWQGGESKFRRHSRVLGSNFLVTIILFLLPLFERDGYQRLNCVESGTFSLWICNAILLFLTSCLFRFLYYKCYGHPWNDINGPDWFKRYYGSLTKKCIKSKKEEESEMAVMEENGDSDAPAILRAYQEQERCVMDIERGITPEPTTNSSPEY